MVRGAPQDSQLLPVQVYTNLPLAHNRILNPARAAVLVENVRGSWDPS